MGVVDLGEQRLGRAVPLVPLGEELGRPLDVRVLERSDFERRG
jgi:hypothetical protein